MNKPEFVGAKIGIDVSDIMYNQPLSLSFDEIFDMDSFIVNGKEWTIIEWDMAPSGYILIFHLDFIPTQDEIDELTETIHKEFSEENKVVPFAVGDEAYWNDPDDDLCSKMVVIVNFLCDPNHTTDPEAVLVVKGEDDCEFEVFLKELS